MTVVRIWRGIFVRVGLSALVAFPAVAGLAWSWSVMPLLVKSYNVTRMAPRVPLERLLVAGARTHWAA